MSLKKQFLKTKPSCKVTFEVNAPESHLVSVVGDFNDWDADKGLLKKLKSGVHKGSFELGTQQSYEFKYLVDGVYYNEPEADAQKWNNFANAENSVINL